METLIDNCILGLPPTANTAEAGGVQLGLATALCPPWGINSQRISRSVPWKREPCKENRAGRKAHDRSTAGPVSEFKDMTQPGHLVEYHKMGGSAGGEKDRAKNYNKKMPDTGDVWHFCNCIVLCIKGDKMCERGRALSVFATIHLLYCVLAYRTYYMINALQEPLS